MRGDRPLERGYGLAGEKFTPHARGSTDVSERGVELMRVYPACAGIDPTDVFCVL